MDVKTLFAVTVALLLLGSFIVSFLKVARLTSTTVERGGVATEIFHGVATLLNLFGGALLLYLLVSHWDYMIKIATFVFGP